MKDRVRDELRQPAAEMRRLEDVLEDAPKVDPRDLVREDRHRTVAEVQGTYIVEPEDVIDVAVRDEDRVDVADIGSKRLLPKIARCIDEDGLPGVLDEYGDSESFILRIVGATGFTITSDRGNTC